MQIIVRMTKEERALIEENMKQIPMINLSAYSRRMLIDGYIILLDTPEIKAHSAQLQKIGVNVNQIAKRINEKGRIYADDMDEVKRLMEEVWKLELRLLLQFKGLIKWGLGNFPTSKMQRLKRDILRYRLSCPYACSETTASERTRKEWNGS